MKKWCFLTAFCILTVSILIPRAITASVPVVETYTVEPRNFDVQVSASGLIEQTNAVVVTAAQAGVIRSVFVEVGSNVQPGDRLIEMADGSFLTAEQAGTVETIARSGGSVAAGETILSMVDTASLAARIKIAEDVIADIQIGQTVELTGSGFKDLVYTGKIQSISAVAKVGNSTAQTTVEAVVQIDEPDARLKPGFTVKASITTATIPDAIIVPSDCVQQDADTIEFVYVLENGKAVRRQVTTDLLTADGLIIKEGLQAGDELILDASGTLGQAQQVAVIVKGAQ